jgi:hypothetical protein
VTTAAPAAGATGEETLLPEVAGDMSRATEEDAFGVSESSLDSDGMVNLVGIIFPSSTGVKEPSLDVAGMKLAGLMMPSSSEQQ